MVSVAVEDARAGSHADEQNEDHHHDRTCGAYSRKRIVSDVFADNDRVDRVIQLLGDIADQQGDREFKDALPGFADGNVSR